MNIKEKLDFFGKAAKEMMVDKKNQLVTLKSKVIPSVLCSQLSYAQVKKRKHQRDVQLAGCHDSQHIIPILSIIALSQSKPRR